MIGHQNFIDIILVGLTGTLIGASIGALTGAIFGAILGGFIGDADDFSPLGSVVGGLLGIIGTVIGLAYGIPDNPNLHGAMMEDRGRGDVIFFGIGTAFFGAFFGGGTGYLIGLVRRNRIIIGGGLGVVLGGFMGAVFWLIPLMAGGS